MKNIVWKSSYEIGVPEVDAQHKMFFELIHAVHKESEASDNPERLKRLLAELPKYTDYHFCSEENKMIDEEYPQIESHRKAHELLLAELRNRVFAIKCDLKDYHSLETFLVDWVFEHILSADVKFGNHVTGRAT